MMIVIIIIPIIIISSSSSLKYVNIPSVDMTVRRRGVKTAKKKKSGFVWHLTDEAVLDLHHRRLTCNSWKADGSRMLNRPAVWLFCCCHKFWFVYALSGPLCNFVSSASQTHRQELQRPHVIPLGLEKFAEDAHPQPKMLLQVLPALGSVLAPALLRHFSVSPRCRKCCCSQWHLFTSHHNFFSHPNVQSLRQLQKRRSSPRRKSRQ